MRGCGVMYTQSRDPGVSDGGLRPDLTAANALAIVPRYAPRRLDERVQLIFLIATVKLKRGDPQAWLTTMLARISDHKITRLDELAPWRGSADAFDHLVHEQ